MTGISIRVALVFSVLLSATASAAPYEDSPFGLLPADVQNDGYPDRGHYNAVDMGVRWNRSGALYAYWPVIEPTFTTPPTYVWSQLDAYVAAVPASMNKLGNILVNFANGQTHNVPGSYLPVDQARYAAFVTAVVERYDGDGLSDMPGLIQPIAYWQVDNEPDARFTADFEDLQALTYTAIKAADATSKVLIGGVTAGGPTLISGWISTFNVRYKPILDALGGQYVDIMDIHWFGVGETDYRMRDPLVSTTDVFGHVRSVLTAAGFSPTLPIWITEMGSASGWASRTERQQAQDLTKRYLYPLALGAKKVFPAYGLMEGFIAPESYFDHTGFIYDGLYANDLGFGTRKLNYYTYKKLTEKLEGSDWSTLVKERDGTGTDRLYVFKVMRSGVPVRVVWWDYFDEPGYVPGNAKALTLTGVAASTLHGTETVPAAAIGADVFDYQTAFVSTSHPVSGGSVTVSLKESPVILEETIVTAPPPSPDPQTPYPGPGRHPIPGVIEAENFDAGGQGISWSDVTPGNTGFAYRAGDVDVYANGGSSNGYAVAAVSKNEWIEHSVDVAQTGRYKVTVRAASTMSPPQPDPTISFWIDHLPLTGILTITNTGGAFAYQDFVIDDVLLSAGPHILNTAAGNGTFTIDKVTFELLNSLEVGVVTVGSSWVTVPLQKLYNAPVVVTTINYRNNSQPVVARIRNAGASSFEIKLQNPGDNVVPVSEQVHFLVMEEGKWLLPSGTKIEARRITSHGTSHNGDWGKTLMEKYTYQHSWTATGLVVLGQVMTTNDPEWSVFWSRSTGGVGQACSGSADCYVGKHVGEDSLLPRANEVLGVVVVQTGSGVLGANRYLAYVGLDPVRGIGNAPPYSYALTGFTAPPAVAFASITGMDNGNGCWAYLYGPTPLATNSMALAYDEDEIHDVDRGGGGQHAGVAAFASAGSIELTPQ